MIKWETAFGSPRCRQMDIFLLDKQDATYSYPTKQETDLCPAASRGHKRDFALQETTGGLSVVTYCSLGVAALARWRHQMETFSTLLALYAGNSPLTLVNSPHKSQWRGALMFSLICAWMNGWVNNREAGDLRRHRAHYDVIGTKLLPVSMPTCQLKPLVLAPQHCPPGKVARPDLQWVHIGSLNDAHQTVTLIGDNLEPWHISCPF